MAEFPLKVFIRICPLKQQEINEGQRIYWKYNETTIIEEINNGQKGYKYEKCFNLEDSNRTIYLKICKPIISKVIEGYHGTLLTCKLFLLLNTLIHYFIII